MLVHPSGGYACGKFISGILEMLQRGGSRGNDTNASAEMKELEMKMCDHDGASAREQKIELITTLSQEDRTLVDRVVLGSTASYNVEGDPWAATLLRRIAEDFDVRDYLCSFAHTEEGAHRVLGVALGLSRMAGRADAAGAASLAVAGWCALALGRWESADLFGIWSLKAVDNYSLGLLIRQAIAERWSADLLDIECSVTEAKVRGCSVEVLRRLTEPRVHIHLS